MAAIEFQAVVTNGMIRIPSEYQAQFTDGVRVILMSDAARPSSGDLLDSLLAHPVRVAGFHPLTRDEAHAR